MSADLLSEPPGGVNSRGLALHLDMSTFYAFPPSWLESPQADDSPITPLHDQPCPASAINTSYDTYSGTTIATAVFHHNESTPCLSPSKFKTSNATYDQDATAFPQQIYYQHQDAAPLFYASPTCDPKHAFSTANGTHCAGNRRQSTFELDSASSQTSQELQAPTTRHHKVGRRRRSEVLDLPLERATYLEKNRKAASKCRSKQKKQQEDLVEQARDYENKNKCLKAELAMLQEGVRELMEVVGQHGNCPDTRLARYVQREADRLASGVSRKSSYAHSQ